MGTVRIIRKCGKWHSQNNCRKYATDTIRHNFLALPINGFGRIKINFFIRSHMRTLTITIDLDKLSDDPQCRDMEIHSALVDMCDELRSILATPGACDLLDSDQRTIGNVVVDGSSVSPLDMAVERYNTNRGGLFETLGNALRPS
jgi:hypothetical protein